MAPLRVTMAPLTAFRNCKFFALIFAVFMHLLPMFSFQHISKNVGVQIHKM